MMKDEDYFKHFYHMVTMGRGLGLTTPFCSQEFQVHIDDVNNKLIKDWYDQVYKVPRICTHESSHCDTKNCLDCNINGKN